MKRIISTLVIIIAFVGMVSLAGCATPPSDFDGKVLQGHNVDKQEYQDNLSLAKIAVD
jgi:predicted small lipoprotein YifL